MQAQLIIGAEFIVSCLIWLQHHLKNFSAAMVVLRVSYDHKVFLKRDGLLPKGGLGTKYM